MINKIYKNFTGRNYTYFTLGFIIIIGLMLIFKRTITNFFVPQYSSPATLFSDKPNSDLYWKALIAIASDNKRDALAIVDAIRSGKKFTQPQEKHEQPSINDFFNEVFLSFVKKNPELLSSLGLFESIGIYDHNAHLNDISSETMLYDIKEKKEYLHRLKQYSIESLSPEQKITYQIIYIKLKQIIDGEKFLFHPYKIKQMNGPLSQITSLMMNTHQLQNAQDFENYLRRLKQIPVTLQQLIHFSEQQEKRGIIPPKFTIDKVIKMIHLFCPQDITLNQFYTRFADNLQQQNIPNKKDLINRIKEILKNNVYHAYHQLQQHCYHLLSKNQTENGVWALPNGDNYYTYMLNFYTSTNLSASEVHEIGLQEVAHLQKEIRQLLKQEGISNPTKTVGELLKIFSQNQKFYYPDTKAGRRECLAKFETIINQSKKFFSNLFNKQPNALVSVQPIPGFQALGRSSAFYSKPSIDGTRPGIFFANVSNLKAFPKYQMKTLAIHEAIPGHHFQMAIQQEQKLHILHNCLNSLSAAFSEGWALYAEKLAYEQGFYTSIEDQIGYLQSELFRAARLVVDTGIHRKRWSKQQALAYLVETTGLEATNMELEVERYFVLPAQACSYKIGQLKILELRQHSQRALGNSFDLRQFHDVILKRGAVPLAMLKKFVEEYINETMAKNA